MSGSRIRKEALSWQGFCCNLSIPKIYIYGITAFSSYILPVFQAPVILAGFVILLSLVGFSGTVCWAVFGSVFARVFREHRKLLNTIMALLLGYCAVSLFLPA